MLSRRTMGCISTKSSIATQTCLVQERIAVGTLFPLAFSQVSQLVATVTFSSQAPSTLIPVQKVFMVEDFYQLTST